MKAAVEFCGTDENGKKEYFVYIVHGCQSFNLQYKGTKEECQWMAKMFRIALDLHDREILDKQRKSKGRKTKKDIQKQSRRT
jgi:hypothetical protein